MNLPLLGIVLGLGTTAAGLTLTGGSQSAACSTAPCAQQAPAGACCPSSASAPSAEVTLWRAATPRAVSVAPAPAADPAPRIARVPQPAAGFATAAAQEEPVHDEHMRRWRAEVDEVLQQAHERIERAVREGECGDWHAQLERALRDIERVRTQSMERAEREVERALREAERARATAQEHANTAFRGVLGRLAAPVQQQARSARERSLEERVADLERRLEGRGSYAFVAPPAPPAPSRDDRRCTPARAQVVIAPRAGGGARSPLVIRVGPDGATEGESFEWVTELDTATWGEEVQDAIEEAWTEVREAWGEHDDDEADDEDESDDDEDVDEEGESDENASGDVVYWSVPDAAVAGDLAALELAGDLAPAGYLLGGVPTAPSADEQTLRALVAEMQAEVEALRAELSGLRRAVAERSAARDALR